MNDQLRMENYLLLLKSTVEVYVHGTLESSNEQVRSLLHDSLHETMTHQANTYDEMVKFGWYQVQNVEKNSINETLEKVQKGN